jgi:thiamine biosynthesis lipoprotein
VGDDCLELVSRSREAWELSGGAFDPSVGPLLEAWGLVEGGGRVPADEEIAALLQLRGMDLVSIDQGSGTLRYERHGVRLDLGGIGKGWVVDACVRRARELGVVDGAVLSGRSTIRVWGTPPRGGRWRVRIDDPEGSDDGLATLELDAGALSTSGQSARCFRRGVELYGHVIDPRVGRPVRAQLGATVWTRDATSGDVLSTALLVLGPDAAAVDGPLESIVRAWTAPGDAPRASFLWLEEDSTVWGGRRVATRSIGEPGFRVL